MAGFRTIVINKRCKLESRLGYLVIRTVEETRVHISEIENLILESTAISLTSALIADLVKEGVNLIFCDSYHLPCGMCMPISFHYNSPRKINIQIGWNSELKKTCWQLIIKEKIKQQAFVLNQVNKKEVAAQLLLYRDKVLPGDIDNMEAIAAKCYFTSLFGDSFSRVKTSSVENSALDYGYAIILSCFSREIVACGYLTELGIWHRGGENLYNLACDLMEPFRPFIDLYVYDMPISEENNFKHYMVNIFSKKVMINNEFQSLIFAIRLFIRKVLKYLNSETSSIYDIQFLREDTTDV